MSVLDGKLYVTILGTQYLVQTPPHGTAPWAQNQAVETVLAKAVSAYQQVAVSASTTLTSALHDATITFNGSTAAQTITLPSAVLNPGVAFTVTNLASVTVSVTSAAGNIYANGTFAPALTRVLGAFASGTNYTTLTLVSNGTSWLAQAQAGTIT